MIDRSYLPFQSAREHRDRGMMKWLGFFLSEHTTSLSDDKRKIELDIKLTKAEKLTLVGQLYASHLTGMFIVQSDKTIKTYMGQVTELNLFEITVKTSDRFQLLRIDEIIEINLVEDLSNE